MRRGLPSNGPSICAKTKNTQALYAVMVCDCLCLCAMAHKRSVKIEIEKKKKRKQKKKYWRKRNKTWNEILLAVCALSSDSVNRQNWSRFFPSNSMFCCCRCRCFYWCVNLRAGYMRTSSLIIFILLSFVQLTMMHVCRPTPCSSSMKSCSVLFALV